MDFCCSILIANIGAHPISEVFLIINATDRTKEIVSVFESKEYEGLRSVK